MPEEESFEATSENRHRGWTWHDMLEQTVPSTGSSNREGLITDGGQSRTTDIQRQWGSRSKASQGLEISRVHELIGEIRRCCPVQTLVDENSKLMKDIMLIWMNEWMNEYIWLYDIISYRLYDLSVCLYINRKQCQIKPGHRPGQWTWPRDPVTWPSSSAIVYV